MQRKHWDTPRTLLQLATTCVFRSKYICSKMKCPTVLKLQPPYLDNTIIRDMVLSLSLIHLRMTDCTTNFHTRYLFLPHEHTVSLLCPCREKCVCTFDLGLLVVCIAPEAGNHYKHFVSRYTCHAMASSDSRQSKVLVMPPEPALICMRAGTGLWCNCGSGEGQCLCPACAQYQSSDVHTPLRFLYGNLHAFWRRRMTLLIEVCK